MMNVIDLFCGCGGFSKGFESAGLEIKLGIDIWEDAVKTFQHNFPNAVALNEDITKLTGDNLLKAAKIERGDVDVIIGGPPCQGFSLSGKRMMDDPRNILYKSFVKMVESIQPKVFVMENVPGLIRLFNGQFKDQVIEDFTEIGYNVQMQQLNSCDYGVPQARKRVFFVGLNISKVKKTSSFVFPEIKYGEGKLPYITCIDALSDLDFIEDSILLPNHSKYVIPPLTSYQAKMREDSNILLNHVTTIHTEKTKSIIALVPDGGNYKDLPLELRSTRKVNIAWTRMDSRKPSFTIDTGHNHHFHYKANRVPTVRESARIQSFPDNFEFLGIKTSQLKQVGNAVPPLMARALAQNIISILGKEE